jgi:hypothetical protein
MQALARVAISRLPQGRFGPLRWIALDLDYSRHALSFGSRILLTICECRGLSRLYPFMHILVVCTGAPYMPCLFHMFRFVSFFFPFAALSCTFAWTYSSNSHSYPPNDPSVGTPPIACKIL